MNSSNKSLLIGNGINRLSNTSVSWEDILEKLVHTNNFPKEALKDIPNTILFECIKLESLSTLHAGEVEAQKQIASMLAEIQPNAYHTRFIESGAKHIFTTNYDYCLEKAITTPVASSGNETKYSLFRRKTFNGTSIWHIHGEIDRPKTIMLGFDHYAGCLQKMRKHLVGELEANEEQAIAALAGRLSQVKQEDLTWIEAFLQNDVDIVGLTLDFTEIDLWWLLGLKKMVGLVQSEFVRKTRYIHFAAENPSRETLARLEALKLYGVEIVPIVTGKNDWRQAYDEYLGRFF